LINSTLTEFILKSSSPPMLSA